MRRLLLSCAVLGVAVLSLTGCRCPIFGSGEGHPHGVCDCYQITPCCTRQPWVEQTPPPPPVALPQVDGKKL